MEEGMKHPSMEALGENDLGDMTRNNRHMRDSRMAVEEMTEWRYTMRRTMQELVPGLFLGPYASATSNRHHLLLQNGITHIVCVRHDSEAYFIKTHFPDKFKHLVLNVSESYMENIIQYFPVVKTFIDDSLAEGGKVLIHGKNGNSRSAAIAIAYIMETFGLSMKEAYRWVEHRRQSISPSLGFMKQLVEFEFIYKARQSAALSQASGLGELVLRHKRPLDNDDDHSLHY